MMPLACAVQKSFRDLLRKQVGDRSVWEYPFAVAGVNITFMLIQMLGLEAGTSALLIAYLFRFEPALTCIRQSSLGKLAKHS